MTRRLEGGWLVAAVAAGLPWVTWIPLTTDNPHFAVIQTPHWLWTLAGLAALACWLVSVDAWLGWLLAWAVIASVSAPWPATLETSITLSLGIVALVSVREIPVAQHGRICAWLTWASVAEVLYLLQQWAGWDLLWRPWLTDDMQIVGTLGNANYVGAYLAIVTPVVQPWAIPLLVGGIGLTHSFTGIVAAGIGLCLRYGVKGTWWGLVGLCLTVAFVLHGVISFEVRGRVWWAALQDQTLWTLLVGHGLGGWISRFPLIQPWQGVGEYFLQAHNEYLQWYYELGVVGLGLLAGWLWSHRRWFTGRYQGAVVSTAMVSFTMFPFHLAAVGAAGVLVLGLAWAAEREETHG